MTKTVCPVCLGENWLEEIREDTIVPKECGCLKLRMIMDFLGPELASAAHRSSDLFRLELDPDTNEVTGDRTEDDLFIKGLWHEAAQHLRWALGAKKLAVPSFTFKMVNDERLLRVYVGDFAYNKRSSKVRDEVETYNNLTDLISGHSLLIVRLGMLGYKNVAAGKVLLETLRVRASEAKPTWLIEGEEYFGDGHLFYSDEVARLIRENFDTVDVGGNVEEVQQLRAQLSAIDQDTCTMDQPSGARAPVKTKESILAAPGALEDRGRSFKKRKWNDAKKGPPTW